MFLANNPKRGMREGNNEDEGIYCITIHYPKNTGYPKKAGDLVYVEVVDGDQHITYSTINCSRHMPRSWEWYPRWDQYLKDGVPIDAYRWQCLDKRPKTRFDRLVVVEGRDMCCMLLGCEFEEVKNCSQDVCVKQEQPLHEDKLKWR